MATRTLPSTMSAAPATTSATDQAVVAAGAVPDSVTVSVAGLAAGSTLDVVLATDAILASTATTLYALRSRA